MCLMDAAKVNRGFALEMTSSAQVCWEAGRGEELISIH